MRILVVDVGGSHIKALVSGETTPRRDDSGPTLTAAQMVETVKKLTGDWTYDVVSIGYPGPVGHNAPIKEPVNLGPGWVGFDFAAAFGKPVKVINDAAMQALGSDNGGRMLFLGLGTGLGSALVVDGRLEPLELAHLPYKKKRSYEDYIGQRGLDRLGKKKWRREVDIIVGELTNALQPDYVVLGGGNARYLEAMPPRCQIGNNVNAFLGGFRLWSSEPLAAPLRARGDVRIVDTGAEFDRAAATLFVECAQRAVDAHGAFYVALSGGSTPRGMNALLAGDYAASFPWTRTHVFWGDERFVPADDPDSNFLAARQSLLDAVPIPAPNIHRVMTELPSAGAAAVAYEADLRAVMPLAEGGLPRFDLIVLGMGDDGHTASLFPGTHALGEAQRWVVENWVGKFFSYRITLTVPVLNNAANVLVLVSGDAKAKALKSVLDGPFVPQQLPAQHLQPTDGPLIWLVDRPAAALLDQPAPG